jgi:hypothetical protein
MQRTRDKQISRAVSGQRLGKHVHAATDERCCSALGKSLLQRIQP